VQTQSYSSHPTHGQPLPVQLKLSIWLLLVEVVAEQLTVAAAGLVVSALLQACLLLLELPIQ